jgi:hypothetical protein
MLGLDVPRHLAHGALTTRTHPSRRAPFRFLCGQTKPPRFGLCGQTLLIRVIACRFKILDLLAQSLRF